jgi:hypothetical protein
MTIIPRKSYIDGDVSHGQYYGQPAFCTPEVKSLVARAIGLKRILASKDPHFNDIPLERWDALHPAIVIMVGRAIREANGNGGIALSDTVCIAKAAARLIKEPSNSYKREV